MQNVAIFINCWLVANGDFAARGVCLRFGLNTVTDGLRREKI
jgi:hypothetical protein